MDNTRTIAFDSLRLHLKKPDGAAELVVAEAVATAVNRPSAVSQTLAAMLVRDDGNAVTVEDARQLPSATREWLLQCIGTLLKPGLRWFEAECECCDAAFDLQMDLELQTFRPASSAVSEVKVCTSLGQRSFSIPLGQHEEQATLCNAQEDARRQMSAICGTAATSADDAAQFDEHDLQLIDDALEAASPDVGDAIQATCPSCGQLTSARIDPLRFAFPSESNLLSDIHLIASAYGWPLDSVLRLSARHRAVYTHAIACDRRAGFARTR